MTVKKIYNGSKFEGIDGRKYIWTGATKWAVKNEKNQLVEVFSTKWAARAWIDSYL